MTEGTVVGRVVTFEDREPVAGARVVVYTLPVPERGTPEHEAFIDGLEVFRTEEDSSFRARFRFDGYGGNGNVLVTAPGRGTGIGQFMVLGGPGAEAIETDVGVVVLPPAPAPIEGRVVDRDGNPLPGIDVRAWASGTTETILAALDPADRATVTDEEGAFRLGVNTAFDSGSLLLRAAGPGFFPAITEVAGSHAEARRVELRLVRSVRLAGRVIDRTGRPIEGALVRSADLGTTAVSPAITDAGGRFEVATAPARSGETSLVAEAAGYAPSEPATVAVTPDSAEGEVVLTLRTFHTFAGRLVDDDGEPIAGAAIRVSTGGPEVETDADGRFRLGGLTEGFPTLRIRSDERPPFEHTIEVDPWKQVSEETIQPLLGDLRGRVVGPDGTGASGVTVLTEALGNGPSRSHEGVSWVATGPDGAFVFEHMPPGPYRLKVISRSTATQWPKGWPVPGLVEVLPVRAASMRGEDRLPEPVEVRLPSTVAVRFRLTGLETPLTPEERALSGLLIGSAGSSATIERELGEPGPDGTYGPVELLPGHWTVLLVIGPRDLGAVAELGIDPGSGSVVVEMDIRPAAQVLD